ncbi:MAG: hypothetical protein WA821_03630, partial [Anaerolineales bacterium]
PGILGKDYLLGRQFLLVASGGRERTTKIATCKAEAIYSIELIKIEKNIRDIIKINAANEMPA